MSIGRILPLLENDLLRLNFDHIKSKNTGVIIGWTSDHHIT